MRLIVEIPDDLHRQVKEQARREGTTIAGGVRSLLNEWVNRPSTYEPAVTANVPNPDTPFIRPGSRR